MLMTGPATLVQLDLEPTVPLLAPRLAEPKFRFYNHRITIITDQNKFLPVVHPLMTSKR